jgi:hypothetical protein
VGTLTEQASRGLAKFSAYGRLRAAVAEAATESAEAEQAARVAAVVVETLQDHLRAHHDQQQAFTAAVGRLDDWLAAMRAELTGGPDHIVQRQVDGGATGAILEAGQRVAFASAPLPSLRFFIDKPAILMQRSWYRSSDYLRGAFANDSQDNSCPDRGGNRSGRDAQPRFSAQVVFLKAC